MKEGTDHTGLPVHAAALLLALLFTAAGIPLRANPAEPSSKVSEVLRVSGVSAEPDSLYAGERVIVTIRVPHGEGTLVSLELPDSTALEPFYLAGQKRSSSRLAAGLAEERFELELAAFGSGRQLLPGFVLVLRDTQGRPLDRLRHRSPASVFVKRLTPPGMLELRPLKPPVNPDFPFSLLTALLLSLLGIAGTVLLVLFFVKRKVRLFAETVDPAEDARRKLGRLKGRLSSGLPPAECYAELSAVMREYLERYYHIRALEAVTQEIERDLRKLGVSSFEAIMNLLRQADLVKFADSRPTAEEARSSTRQAEEIVGSGRHGEG